LPFGGTLYLLERHKWEAGGFAGEDTWAKEKNRPKAVQIALCVVCRARLLPVPDLGMVHPVPLFGDGGLGRHVNDPFLISAY